MTIAPHFAEALAAFAKSGKFGPRCLCFGRRRVAMNYRQFAGLVTRHGLGEIVERRVKLHDPDAASRFDTVFAERGKWPAVYQQHAESPQMISDTLFFTALGFEVVETVDFPDTRPATHQVDLNSPGLAQVVNGPYDLVYDGGTLAHLFHVPNALLNLHEVTAVGGYVWHDLPANGYVDHGFYSFSPTLFFDYYAINDYLLTEMRMLDERTELHDGGVRRFPYPEQGLAKVKEVARMPLSMSCIAQRTSSSTADRMPMQTFYTMR